MEWNEIVNFANEYNQERIDYYKEKLATKRHLVDEPEFLPDSLHEFYCKAIDDLSKLVGEDRARAVLKSIRYSD